MIQHENAETSTGITSGETGHFQNRFGLNMTKSTVSIWHQPANGFGTFPASEINKTTKHTKIVQKRQKIKPILTLAG